MLRSSALAHLTVALRAGPAEHVQCPGAAEAARQRQGVPGGLQGDGVGCVSASDTAASLGRGVCRGCQGFVA